MKNLPQHRKLWGGAALCFLLVFVFSACSSGGNPTPPHASHSSSCTALPGKSSGKGADAAVVANVPLPGHPFQAVATNNGQWIFASVESDDGASNEIAVLHNTGKQVCLQRVIRLSESPLGLALTHDNSVLLVADLTNITFVDVALAETSNQKAIIGSLPEQDNAVAIEVTLSQDERYAFVANENLGTVGVIDMQRVRARDFSPGTLVGYIPVNTGPLDIDSGPVGLAVSPDNRYLYVTSRIDTGDPSPQGNTCFRYPPGTLSVVDIARAEQDPAHAVLARVFVGCSPVRVVLSPSGDTAWVTVREEDVVKAFSTARLQSDPAHAQLARLKAGDAPTGESLVDHGAVLVVTNSNRFRDPQSPQTLSLFNTQQALQGNTASVGTVDVGAFPRELILEASGQTLLLTNYNSNTLSFIDVTRLPV